ncbi:hypothetical protein BvCmsNSNP023_01821 [Escherichia coli]|nr:hypothetical protein BvCmsNSNP023_01821 [Escherichia coli]
MDTLVTGRRIKCLTCVDDIYEGVFNNNHSIRDFRSSGLQVTRILDCIALFQGYPVTIRPEQNPVGQTNVEHIS